jgi:Restriction endonuclease
MAGLAVGRRSPRRTDTERERRRRDCARRRALRRQTGAPGKTPVGQWRRICARDGYICWLCHHPIDPALRVPQRQAATVDHVIPLAAGGTDDDANLRPAHLGCNSRRSNARF